MKTVVALCVFACLLEGAPPAALKPGEGLAIATLAGDLQVRGEAQREGPLGDLACLPWLRLEGFAWSSAKLTFHCNGGAAGRSCTLPAGHGRVDLRTAFERNCRLALLAWISHSAAGWVKMEGPVPARMKLQEVFQPFLGARFPKGEELPALGLEWAGAGDLLRSSPAALARWLADPAQEPAEPMFRRYGAGFFEGDLGGYQGWTYVGRAGAGPEACTWVAGGLRGGAAALRMVGTPGREEARKRFRDLLRGSTP